VHSVFWSGNAKTGTPTTWTMVEGAGPGSLSLPSFRSSAIAITSTGVEYFVGTSVGLFNAVGLPGAISWAQDGAAEIGNAPVTSLTLRPSDNKLLAGTHGYGMWYAMLSLPVVPVTLIEFKGTLQDKNILLQWTTSAEYNNKHFELEKSLDGINFRKIVTIPASGNSTSIRNYNYLDREPLTEKNYYRLRSVDIDNRYKLSNTVLIKPPGLQQDIQVLGNPFRDNITVRFVKAAGANGQLRLIDLNGRVVHRKNFGQGDQFIQFRIPEQQLGQGIYILEAVIGKESYRVRVLRE
jgi:hypothetical protein